MAKKTRSVLPSLMGAAAFSLLVYQQVPRLYAQGTAPRTATTSPARPISTKEIDALIANIHDNNFYSRNAAAKAIGGKGVAGVPAIPALMDILGDERNNAAPGYSLLVNGSRAIDIAGYASDSLRKLIPLSNGFGFDYARTALLAPLPDYSGHALMEDSKEGRELIKRRNLAGLLSAYGDRAIPVLRTLVYKYGDSHEDLISKIQEAGTWALADFGTNSTSLLCEVLTNHPNWSVRRIAVMGLLRNKGLPFDGNEDQAQMRQKMCPANRGGNLP